MILDAIVVATKQRVAAAKKVIPLKEIRQKALALPPGDFPFETALGKSDLAFICEIKKASPSKGVIAEEFSYLEIAQEYERAGANAISVLTESNFFQGSDHYLSEIRQRVRTPLLRKDFTIDVYQLYEAKLIGADAVLLICALLDTKALRRYLKICNQLGLSALVEAHNAQEVASALAAGARVIGVNNRDLKTFVVNLETCIQLRPMVPEGLLFVAESGIKTAEDIAALRKAKVDAVLIGEAMMRSENKKQTLKMLREGIVS